MSGSKKALFNVENQLKNLKKDINQNVDTDGRQIAILDSIKFRNSHERSEFNTCQRKAKQHKSSRRRVLNTTLRKIGNVNHVERLR